MQVAPRISGIPNVLTEGLSNAAQAASGMASTADNALAEGVSNMAEAGGDAALKFVSTLKELLPDSAVHANIAFQLTQSPIQVGRGVTNQTTYDIGASKKPAEVAPGCVDQSEINGVKNRLERDTAALQHALLSQSVYQTGTAPEGWTNISDDPKALAKYGLAPSDLKISGDSNFSAQVYVPDPAVFGDSMKPTVAFKGTEPTNWEDWANNLAQGVDMNAPYYEKAVAIGEKLRKRGANVDITGHSLGGGLASAASQASGLPADTFNAAGLNEHTVKRYGGTVHDSAINAYRVDGEILTGIQEQSLTGTLVGGLGKVILSHFMPDAKGAPIELPGHGLNPIARHGMDQVIDGLEARIAEDQEKLKQAKEMDCN